MARIVLTDGSGRWFESSSADKWDEDTRWNGNNHVSLATGSQWDHEKLYRTKGKRWILRRWSQWQGSGEAFEEVSETVAARWLSINNHHDEAPEALAAEIASLEVA